MSLLLRFCLIKHYVIVKHLHGQLVMLSTFKFIDDMGTPYVEFNNLIDLNCTNRNGSIQIYNTTGKYWIQSHTFQGSKGHVDWRERSWSSDSVYEFVRLLYRC